MCSISLRATFLTSSRSASVSTGIGPGQQVENGELGLRQPLASGPLFLVGEVARERLQAPQHLVDVEAAGVVLVDQLAQLLDESTAGSGCAARLPRSASPSCSRSASRRTASGPRSRAASASKSIALRSISDSASEPSAAARITYSSAPTERSSKLAHRAGNVGDVGRLVERADRLGQVAGDADDARLKARRPGRAGSPRTAAAPRRSVRGSARRVIVVDEQRLDRRVAQRDELEALGRRQRVEVDVPAVAEVDAARRSPRSSSPTSADLSRMMSTPPRPSRAAA